MESFIFQAGIYLFVAALTVALTTRLGLGSVLGYLGAGILLGSIFEIAGAEAQSINNIAEIGVVMMLFLIGLDLEPATLWKMRRKLFGLGISQIILTTIVIASVFFVMGHGLNHSATIGLILSLSSTAIVLQTLGEKKLLQTNGGRSSFCVLIMQDVAVVPILIILPLLAFDPGNHNPLNEAANNLHLTPEFLDQLPIWARVFVLGGAMGGTILFGIYGVPRIFHIVDAVRHRDLHIVASFVIVLGIAILMVFAGLPPALGAFLAGVALANSAFRHHLMVDILPFKGLFIGLFFITVGIEIDFSLVINQPSLIVQYTLILIFSKMLVLFAIALAFKIKGNDRLLFVLSLAQSGEFSLLLLSFISNQNLIPGELLNNLAVATAFSMLLTPFLFGAYERLSRKFYAEDVQKNKERLQEHDDVIIAGIDRFAQVVSRIVESAGYRAVLIDDNLEAVQTLRRMGVKCFFGTPTRPKLLLEAGLENAKVLVVSIKNIDDAQKLISFVHWSQPDLYIVARARNNLEFHKLDKAGASAVVRETFESSVYAGRHALEGLGYSSTVAKRHAEEFYENDLNTIRELSKFWDIATPVDKNDEFMTHSQRLNMDMEAEFIARLQADDDSNLKDNDR